MQLRDRVAIVTGAARGIGRGIAERLAAEGARVVANDLDGAALDAALAGWRQRGFDVLAAVGDVGLKADVDRMFDAAVERYGGVDVLVNNAGWATAGGHFLEIDEAHWDQVMRINLKSVYLCSHRAANLMVDQGRRGSIISISSFAAARAHRQQPAYDASKGGVEALTRAMALDLAPFGIRCNVVGPGAIHTEYYEPLGEAARAERARAVPLGRVGYPADIAGAVLFLAGDDASYITGQCLYVDGGMLAGVRSPQIDKPLPPSVAARLKRG